MKRPFFYLFLLILGCGHKQSTGYIAATDVVNKTEELKKENFGWVSLKDRVRVDGYTRIDSIIFCGEVSCNVKPMTGIDTASFQVWAGSDYARDREKVYYPRQVSCIDYTDCGVCYCSEYIVESANPNTFKYLSKEYATDGSKVYFRGELMEGADGATFKVIDGPEFFFFATDKDRVYKHDQIFTDADPRSFYHDKQDERNNEYTYIISDKDNKWEFTPPNTIKKIEKKN
ncbi:DKNYY domain-containing protein [Pontibacter chitinilyticus]|uniref:DKNYY domain-containing protein n=1 Tax=Pontibacter chitinilyticus TaxID=2674989 RepID=UPI00321B6608